MTNNSLFNADENTNFSLLRGKNLQDLLNDISNYYLTYRKSLNLPKNITFGIEIEYESQLFGVIRNRLKLNKDKGKINKDWAHKNDGSLSDGGEITSPIMSDDENYWRELQIICNFLTNLNVNTSKNSGGHIHIGANALGDDVAAWKNFLKLYCIYEKEFFRFFYGDKINARYKILEYAHPISCLIHNHLHEIENAKMYFPQIYFALNSFSTKYNAVNFINIDPASIDKENEYHNTIEFRSPNATTNEVIWQNNINAITKLLLVSKNEQFDKEFVDYKISHSTFPTYNQNPYAYHNINLKNVLELVDLIFDNNLDKIYFLRQYLKDFEHIYEYKRKQDNFATKQAKTFVRRKENVEELLLPSLWKQPKS